MIVSLYIESFPVRQQVANCLPRRHFRSSSHANACRSTCHSCMCDKQGALPVCLLVHLSVCLFGCQSVCLFVCLSLRPFVCLLSYLSVHLSVCLSIHPFICLFSCLCYLKFLRKKGGGLEPCVPNPNLRAKSYLVCCQVYSNLSICLSVCLPA